MEHEIIEFFPQVVGVYSYPEDKHEVIKLTCQKIRDTIKPCNDSLGLLRMH